MSEILMHSLRNVIVEGLSAIIIFNNIIHRSLTRAGIPAIKEPQGLSRSERPDSLKLTPWRKSRCLLWDITVADATTISYLPTTAITAGSAAELAATGKLVKYEDCHKDTHLCLYRHRVAWDICKSALDFLHELGLRTTAVTLDPIKTSCLFQHLSLAMYIKI